MIIKPINQFNKTIRVASDKSITHRAIMFNSLAKEGVATISNALVGADCLSTIDCMRRLGADISVNGDIITVGGIKKFKSCLLDVGNSGTTIRLLCGILSANFGSFGLFGDESILRRPMGRVIAPLQQMGAKIGSNNNSNCAPLMIEGRRLDAIEYEMPIASAQVKSAILLGGLYANGTTKVVEKVISRNHTEIMLEAMGANIKVQGKVIEISKSAVKSVDVSVPADISSASYFIVLANIIEGAKAKLTDVNINETRTGIIDVLLMCGANITYNNRRVEIEDIADIQVEYTKLKPFDIRGDIIPRLIDEIPILAVMACYIDGTSYIRDAQELKVKESNRIDTTVNALKKLGANIESTDDGMIIYGSGGLKGGESIDPKLDHRIAMSMAIAMAGSELGGQIVDADCCKVSYPKFFEDLLD